MDRWRMFLHRSDTGAVHLDAIDTPIQRPRTVHHESWGPGSLRAMSYPTAQFTDPRHGRLLVYRPTTGSTSFLHVTDDGFTPATATKFATGWTHFVPVFLTSQFGDGEGMLAYRATSGDLHVDRLL